MNTITSSVISILKTSFQILVVGVALIAIFSLVQVSQNLRGPASGPAQGSTSRPSEKRTDSPTSKKSLEISQIR